MVSYLHVAFENDPKGVELLHEVVEPLVGTDHVRVFPRPESDFGNNVVAWITDPSLFSRGLLNRAAVEYVDRSCCQAYVHNRLKELS